jgi:hypothetical protein
MAAGRSKLMSDALPIGVVLPVLNCRELLPGHLAALQEWAGLVQEIVVVDSFSTDGTLEFLKEQLPFPHARFITHPRGLYQSWNFGTSQIAAKYTYISTVGDLITAKGLRDLLAVAERFQSEVSLCPPRFVGLHRNNMGEWCWPIHRLIREQSIEQPMELTSTHAFLMTALWLPLGILGSSASNLYRTDSLKRRPFPVEYGDSGDTGWSVRYALETRFAVMPEVVSQFVIHPKSNGPGDDQIARFVDQFFVTAIERCREKKENELGKWLESLRTETASLRAKQLHYDGWRQHAWPWIFNPRAWQLRSRRNQQRDKLAHLKKEMEARFGLIQQR